MALHLIPSDKTIRTVKPDDERRRLSDGEGLYLLLFVKGGAHGWLFDYAIGGLRKLLGLGTYPDTGLAAARKKADDYRQLVAQAWSRVSCERLPVRTSGARASKPGVLMPACHPAVASRPWPGIG